MVIVNSKHKKHLIVFSLCDIMFVSLFLCIQVTQCTKVSAYEICQILGAHTTIQADVLNMSSSKKNLLELSPADAYTSGDLSGSSILCFSYLFHLPRTHFLLFLLEPHGRLRSFQAGRFAL